jgi:aminopeptidase N
MSKTDADFNEVTDKFDRVPLIQKVSRYKGYINYLANVNNTANFKKGIDKIIVLRNQLAQYRASFKTDVNAHLENLKNKKQALKTLANGAEIDEQIDYLDKKMK